MPHRDQADGFVSSSRPLILAGALIEGFTVTFEKGHAVRIVAKKGEEHLRKHLETDESASHLGEVALVPNSSPISQRKHLFYNTLYDENAASHIALGAAYRYTMTGGSEMSKEEFIANGGNVSLIHTDFMIGSDKMDVDGIRADGNAEPVMRKGEWAFKA
jgi:aminopeptidase